jgi:hypothetical protein
LFGRQPYHPAVKWVRADDVHAGQYAGAAACKALPESFSMSTACPRGSTISAKLPTAIKVGAPRFEFIDVRDGCQVCRPATGERKFSCRIFPWATWLGHIGRRE